MKVRSTNAAVTLGEIIALVGGRSKSRVCYLPQHLREDGVEDKSNKKRRFETKGARR